MEIQINNYNQMKYRLQNIGMKYTPFVYDKLIRCKMSLLDRKVSNIIEQTICKYTNFRQLPLFSHIQIETISCCNGSCSFCPVNKFIDPRPTIKMSEILFKSIIKQLVDLNYQHQIVFSSNNEPLMDKRIENFITYTKERLPQAKLVMWTNGKLLTLKRFKKLTIVLDKLIFDNYNDHNEWNHSAKEIFKYIKKTNDKSNLDLIFFMRRETDILNTRAGGVKNRRAIKPLKSPCLYPFSQFNVRPDGKISLCCVEALGKKTLGDLTKESLVDIWYNDKFNNIREKLQNKNGRKLIAICSGCDELHFHSKIPQPSFPNYSHR